MWEIVDGVPRALECDGEVVALLADNVHVKKMEDVVKKLNELETPVKRVTHTIAKLSGLRKEAKKCQAQVAETDPEIADAMNNHGQPEMEEDTTFGNEVLYCYQNGKLLDHVVKTPNMSDQEWEQEKARFRQKYVGHKHPDFVRNNGFRN